jgi:hypothetical protein
LITAEKLNGAAATRTCRAIRQKRIYGKTPEQIHDKWIELQGKARQGVVATSTPTVAEYLSYWSTRPSDPTGPADLPGGRLPPTMWPGLWPDGSRLCAPNQ